MSKHSSRRSDQSGAVTWGLILVAIGGWFLLKAIGISLPGMGTFWPIFPTLVGLGLFVAWLFSRDKRSSYGMAIPATINSLIGVFFFGFTLGIFEWRDMGVLWPVFPLIVGIAFIVAWVFSFFKEWGLLIPGGITGAVGVIGLAFTLAGSGNIFANLVVRGWPVILILVGLGVLVRGFFGKGDGRPPPAEEEAFIEDFRSPEEERVAKEYKHKDDQ